MTQFLYHATPDILNFLFNPSNSVAPEFVMEVTDKTRADVKVCRQFNNYSYFM